MHMQHQFATLVAAIGLCAGGSTSALATFIIDPDPGGEKFYNGDANKNVSSFVGSVGSQSGGDAVKVDTIGNVDTGAGYSNIKPANKDTILSQLTFTPADGNLFNEFSFRGQLLDAAGGELKITVVDNQTSSSQEFTITGLGGPNDFNRVGITSVDGSTIKSVTLTSVFKEQKQNEFSYATPVPEPSTYIAAALLLIPLLVQARRWKRSA